MNYTLPPPMAAFNRSLDYPAISTLQHWLVNHPKILNFSWNQGHTIASSPLFVAITLLCYLFFTYFLPKQVSRHPPLPRRLLKPISAIYNIAILTFSLTMAVGCALSVISSSPNFKYFICFPKHTTASGPIFFWIYMFYLSKIIEFTDTLLIILSNSSEKRLTFLHLFHHTMAVIMCYLALNLAESSFHTLLVTNCLVHVLMHSYYSLTSLDFRPRWKKTVTDCQLMQFCSSFPYLALFIYYRFTREGCSGTWGWCFNMFFIICLLLLFTNFHRNTYSSPKIKST